MKNNYPRDELIVRLPQRVGKIVLIGGGTKRGGSCGGCKGKAR